MEKKEKYTLEYTFKSSPKVLYNRISTPGGLAEWFADDVMLNGKKYIFQWDGSEQIAELIAKKDGVYTRFRWVDEEDDKAYFEFRITVDEITGDVALIVTDFAYPDEKEDNIDLWEAQIEDLHHLIG
jgi:uncharacterized protein YndB with AHSA1/START domain